MVAVQSPYTRNGRCRHPKNVVVSPYSRRGDVVRTHYKRSVNIVQTHPGVTANRNFDIFNKGHWRPCGDYPRSLKIDIEDPKDAGRPRLF